ncbi:MAG: hypothetical protein GXO40_06085 [Epsilonproteobacteria bacterium]|nr:hypothetical protein [Campylobacterota bacterium]
MFDISQVGKILKAANRLNMPAEFNATLPLNITVKKQLNPIRYLLKLGNKELETRSYTPLEVGRQYKAIVTQHGDKIEIKNLHKIPNIFMKFPDSITYSVDDLLEDDPLQSNEKYKQFLMHHLANANNKEEFLFYSQLFLAFNQNIKHLFIKDKTKAIIQMKPTKKQKLSFWGYFEHLGAIGGEIYLADELYLTLIVEFLNSLNFLQKHIEQLHMNVTLKQDTPPPLFEVTQTNSLLNLKV